VAQVKTVYVQQEQRPGGWEDNAETDDRALALSRYKAFAAGSARPTRLIERTERVLSDAAPQKKGRR
jgi:hypothetical protein